MTGSENGRGILDDTAILPTHLARVVARVNLTGPDACADTFLMASYVIEALVKSIAIALCAGIQRSSPNIAYKFKYELVRADGLAAR